MGERNEHVSVHYGASYLGLLDVFAPDYRYGDVVSALEAVADDDRTAYGKRRKAVLSGAVQVLDGVLAAAWI